MAVNLDQMAIKYLKNLPLQDPPKFALIGISGLKTCNLATLQAMGNGRPLSQSLSALSDLLRSKSGVLQASMIPDYAGQPYISDGNIFHPKKRSIRYHSCSLTPFRCYTDQGCQIFLGTKYQHGEKYIK
jgi:hypothetical protein